MLLQSLFVVFLVFFGYTQAQGVFDPVDNVVSKWVLKSNDIAFTTARFSIGFIIRVAYMMNTAMFDATCPYSKEIKPFIATDIPKKIDLSLYNDANRKKALSYAAYRVLKHYFGNYTVFQTIITDFMEDELNYDINYVSTELTTPAGIGNYVAKRVIASRQNDNINENGDKPGTVDGKLFSDWTQYYPVNYPQAVNGRTQCSELRNINRWQPLKFNGVVQVWDGPHLGLGTPFALSCGLEFVTKIPGPALFGTNTDAEAWRQLEEMINISKNLGDREKITGEYIAFNSYNNFVVWLARERHLNLVQTVKLAALHGGAEWDSVVGAWAIKHKYDNARPVSQIQCKKVGQTIRAYGGPYQGAKDMLGENWQPYPLIPTPEFPDYVSGHSHAAGTVFEAYKRFFGSDSFGFNVTIAAGGSFVEPKIDDPQDPRYIAGVTNVPNTGPGTPGYSPAAPVTLRWSTFSEAAEASALSRMYLGIHYRSASYDGVTAGRFAGAKAYELYKTHLTGKTDAQ